MPYSLTWLPDVLEAAGLKVATVPGWEERGRGDVGAIQGVLCHHTGGSAHGNMPTLRLLIHGRSDLPGPLSQLGLGRDGTFYVIAAGRCNHAGKGEWRSIRTGNTSFIGIEAENTGSVKDFPWPAVQMDAYHRGVAAILKHVGKDAAFCAAHREYAHPAGRKPDPIFDMVAFRNAVSAFLRGTAPAPVLIPPEDGCQRPTLRRGMQHERVKELQRRLGVEPAGVFGPKTEAAVRAFQRERGMVPDGIVGPKTWAELDRDGEEGRPAVVETVVREVERIPDLRLPPMALDALVQPPDEQGDPGPELARVGDPRAVPDWDEDLTRAVQGSLAKLYLLNPWDDVDGDAGPRTVSAWRLFREAAGLAPGTSIDAESAARLAEWSGHRDDFIGKPKIVLEEDFAFRRNRREANRANSVGAIRRVAEGHGLEPAQVAYILATAEHESDRFATLEEYATGDAYERRADLGNIKTGDGRRFKGRGFVQLTGRNNYRAYTDRTGIRLLDLPTILMNWPMLSAWVIVDGMMRGAYTGKRLDAYVKGASQDFVNARRVVNGLDRAEKIAQRVTEWLRVVG